MLNFHRYRSLFIRRGLPAGRGSTQLLVEIVHEPGKTADDAAAGIADGFHLVVNVLLVFGHLVPQFGQLDREQESQGRKDGECEVHHNQHRGDAPYSPMPQPHYNGTQKEGKQNGERQRNQYNPREIKYRHHDYNADERGVSRACIRAVRHHRCLMKERYLSVPTASRSRTPQAVWSPSAIPDHSRISALIWWNRPGRKNRFVLFVP